MSFIRGVQKVVKKGIDLIPSEYRGGINGDPAWFWPDETFEKGQVFTYKDHFSSLTAYKKCAPLAAIINRMAQSYITGKTWVMDLKGKESTSEPANKIRKLLAKPNPLQSWKQFEAQQQIYMDLFGFCFLMPIIAVGYEKYGAIEATSLWNIPPSMLAIQETNKLFYQTDLKGIISEIKMDYKGQRKILDINNLYIFKDFTPSSKTLVFPESRICSLEMQINNIIGAYESRNVLINYRGALGIFTQEPNRGQFVNAPLKKEQKEELQREFMRYGIKNKQWKFIMSEASIKWQQIGIATRELMLFEEIQDDIMRICDAYGYPSPLINSEKGPAVANTKEFKAQLYQDAIIPKAESNYEQWNQVFKTEEYGLRLEKDYTHLPVLQEAMKGLWESNKSRADATLTLWKNDMITRNRLLYLNGEDTLGPKGDIYFSEYTRQQTALNPPPVGPAAPAANA